MIKTEISGTAAIIKLNRPEKRNALSPGLITLLKQSLASYEDDKTINSVIITGEGKAFCAGADLEYLSKLSEYSVIENRKDSQEIAELFLKIYEYPKPVIAAVNGPAIAGGCGLASVCDFVIADPHTARFGYTEVKIGFIPAIVSIFLIKRIGESKAKRLLLSGEIIEPDEAVKIGLIDYISENPMETAQQISSRLDENSAFSISLTKKIIRDVSSMNHRDAVNYCLELNTAGRTSEDFIKGINSFLKK